VTIVDTGQSSFAEGLCVLEAAEALEAGATIDSAAGLAKRASAAAGTVWMANALALAQRGGRVRGVEDANVAVFAREDGQTRIVGSARTLNEAAAIMSSHVEAAAQIARASGASLRLGIGDGDAKTVAEGVRRRMEALPYVNEIIDYVVGPSVGVLLGAGNAEACYIARPLA